MAGNTQNDVLISGSVLLGLVFIYVFRLPIFDMITALLVSLWILAASNIFRKPAWNMDGTKDCAIYDKI
jgi:divalent metal cation (Fe/Co/Zn/Cd) transporter